MKLSPKTKTFLYHFLGVILFILYEQGLLIIGIAKVNTAAVIIFYIADVSFFYFLSLVMLPRFANGKFILPKIVLMVVCCFAIFSLLQLLAGGAYSWFERGEFLVNVDWEIAKKVFVRFFFLFLLGTAYFLAREGIRRAKESRDLKITNLELENAYLQAKINPHLLFNTLNYIDHLVGKHSASASTMVQLLSEVMHYGLRHEKASHYVPIEAELEQVEHYIELIRRRNNDQLQLIYHISVSDEAMKALIPPMLFISCLDNIFKHGDLHNADMPARIEIFDQQGVLHLHTVNTKKESPPTQGHGTGINFMRKRLEQAFTGRFRLEITDKPQIFELNLTIEL
jgi:two-component system LytT family sensor kinase